MIEALKKDGFYKLQNFVDSFWVEKINKELPVLFRQHEELRRANSNPIISKGVAMNAIVGSSVLQEFFDHLICIGFIELLETNYFYNSCILNSFSALSNISSESEVFHKKVHRDIRGFSSSIPLMINTLIMLDDFTEENGATLLLPKSHLTDEAPTDDYFEKNHIIGIGQAGDILVWNSNLFHASGHNKTQNQRRALAITFSLPYYKQLLDYPKAIGENWHSQMDEITKRIIGFDSQVPQNLHEWYSPLDKIKYKN